MATLYANPPAVARYADFLGVLGLGSTSLTALPAAMDRVELLADLRARAWLAGTPLDAAFSRRLNDTVDDLLLPGNEAELASVLRYHAIAVQVQARHEARASIQRSS